MKGGFVSEANARR